MSKPIIGISGSWLADPAGPFAMYPRAYVNHDYVRAVTAAGGVPFIIPFNESEEVIKESIHQIDGLILSGGHDVSPRFYNEEALQKLGQVWPERDIFDMTLFKYAQERKIPIMGICRGMQIVNVALGGSMYQDLSYCQDIKLKHSQGSDPSTATIKITLEENSIISRATGQKELWTNSFHHQVVKEVGKGLRVTAKASDTAIKALEGTDYPYLALYQFHPEMMAATCKEAHSIFVDFIKKATQ